MGWLQKEPLPGVFQISIAVWFRGIVRSDVSPRDEPSDGRRGGPTGALSLYPPLTHHPRQAPGTTSAPRRPYEPERPPAAHGATSPTCQALQRAVWP